MTWLDDWIDPVTWTYMVTNAGNVPLANVTVTDDQGVALSCPQTMLAPGESMTCTAQGTAECGQYANLGMATGTGPAGNTVSDSDPSHYHGGDCQSGNQGCSHGYWKTHPQTWAGTGFSPSQLLVSVFSAVSGHQSLVDDTLMDGLNYGGSGTLGAARNLLKQAVAAVLNASHPNVSYPLSLSAIIADVNWALNSHDRNTMLGLAGELDQFNNLYCPF